MVKRTISFTLIILALFLVYQYLITMMKNKHDITYYINNGEESFTIDEKYIKENGNDYYLIKVTKDDKKFVYKVENEFNKQKNIVEDLEIFEQDGYYCMGLNLVGSGKYSFPTCEKDDVLYSYNSLKDKLDFDDYISKIEDDNIERYSKDSSKTIDSVYLINREYFDKNEIMMIYGYKQMSLQYFSFSRSFTFSSLDNYKNTYGALVGNYYVIPRLNSLATYSNMIKYDVIDGIKKEIPLPVDVSKQSYVMGVHDNKLYIFDNSNKRQLEIDPYNDEVKIVGNINEEGFTYVNGEKKSISVYDLDKEVVKFEDNIDDYSSIEYDSIIKGDYYAVYKKDNNYYLVYKEFTDSPILLFSGMDIHNIIIKGDNVYYIKENTIYKCNKYGTIEMVSGNEFIYNYENIFDVYLK